MENKIHINYKSPFSINLDEMPTELNKKLPFSFAELIKDDKYIVVYHNDKMVLKDINDIKSIRVIQNKNEYLEQVDLGEMGGLWSKDLKLKQAESVTLFLDNSENLQFVVEKCDLADLTILKDSPESIIVCITTDSSNKDDIVIHDIIFDVKKFVVDSVKIR